MTANNTNSFTKFVPPDDQNTNSQFSYGSNGNFSVTQNSNSFQENQFDNNNQYYQNTNFENLQNSQNGLNNWAAFQNSSNLPTGSGANSGDLNLNQNLTPNEQKVVNFQQPYENLQNQNFQVNPDNFNNNYTYYDNSQFSQNKNANPNNYFNSNIDNYSNNFENVGFSLENQQQGQIPQYYENTNYANYQVNNSPNNFNNNQNYNQITNNVNSYSKPANPTNTFIANKQSTFREQKSGNKLFFIISGIVIFILMLATGILAWQNLQTYRQRVAQNQSTNNNLNNSQNNVSLSSSESSQSVNNNLNNNNNNNNNNNLNSSVSSSSSFFSQNLQNNNQNNQNNQSLNNSQNFTNSTGPRPAFYAKQFNLTQIPTDWLAQKFPSSDIDLNGRCQNLARCGEQADPDRDGLSNMDEYNYQTDPLNPDTDNDSISDGDEIYIYETNPVMLDSDNDRYGDMDEILACLDPTFTNLDRNSKMSNLRLQEIQRNTEFSALNQVTINRLKAAGATTKDLQQGYLSASCLNNTGNNFSNPNNYLNNSLNNPFINNPSNNQNNNQNSQSSFSNSGTGGIDL